MPRAHEQGSALLLTIVVTVVVLFLGGAFGLIGMMESRRVQREETAMQAYYLARSGADAMAQAIISDPTILDKGIVDIASELVPLGSGAFTVKVTRDGTDVRVKSTGIVRGQEHIVELKLEGESLFKHAVVALGTGSGKGPAIKIAKNPNIYGDMATNATEDGSVIISGNVRLNGYLYVGSGAKDPKEVVQNTGNGKFDVVKLSAEAKYPDLVFPDLPEDLPDRGNKTDCNTIDADGHYDSISTSGDLEIDLGGGTRIIRVVDLHLGGSLKLTNVAENGRLLLFVTGTIALGKNITVNWTGEAQNPSAFTLYYSGSETLKIEGNQSIAGSLVIGEAALDMSGNQKIVGNLFTLGSKVDIDFNPNPGWGLIYAPNGKVTISQNGSFGPVIAKGLVIEGNPEITLPTDEGLENLVKTFPAGIFGPGFADAQDGGLRRGTWSAMR